MKRRGTDIELISKYPSKRSHQMQSFSDWLQNELNPDCLIEVFQFLSFKDLTSICRLDDNDQFFKSLIKGYVISQILVPLEYSDVICQEGCLVEKTLRTFGKSIKRLKLFLESQHFNDLLKLIIRYCSPDRINELQLEWKSYNAFNINWSLMDKVIPYLRGIKHLDIGCCYYYDFSEFCLLLINEAKNIETLKLTRFQCKPILNRIKFEKSELKELRIFNTDLSYESESLDNYIKKLPLLEVFEIQIKTDLRPTYGDTLAKYCPKLRIFSDMINGHQDDVNYYNFLHHFKYLENVTISLIFWGANEIKNIPELFSNLYRNYSASLSKLTLNVSYSEYRVIFRGYPKFTDAEFHLKGALGITDFSQWKMVIQSLRSIMEGVRKITMIGGKICNMDEVLQHMPRIEEVSIHTVELHQPPAEVRKIKRTIETNVKEYQNLRQSEKVHFFVNWKQETEFKILMNIGQFITLSVKEKSG